MSEGLVDDHLLEAGLLSLRLFQALDSLDLKASALTTPAVVTMRPSYLPEFKDTRSSSPPSRNPAPSFPGSA
jgi:hypothetical protein